MIKYPGQRSIHAMGHKFGDELECICGVTWGAHQLEPAECKGEHPKLTYEAGSLGALCRRNQITHKRLADHCGVTRETARRVLVYHPMVSRGMREAIIAGAHELLLACGVDVGGAEV